jgi:hypothetical protein
VVIVNDIETRNRKSKERKMIHKKLVLYVFLAVETMSAVASGSTKPQTNLSATEIVDRNVAARGGLRAWRSVETLVMSGNMEAGGNNGPVIPTAVTRGQQSMMPPPRPLDQAKLPFVMELQRPRKMRIELQFKGQTAVQVFDGTNGWKIRPFLNRKDVEPYTAEEMKTVPLQSELDGPLVDYAAKGTRIELEGIEKVEDRDAYKLKLTLKGGEVTHVWIDAETFLEDKVSGVPRRLDGRYRPVEVYYRDYRSLGALKVPFVFETRVLNTLSVPGSKTSGMVAEKIVLDKVSVNPTLDASVFSKPGVQTAQNNPH